MRACTFHRPYSPVRSLLCAVCQPSISDLSTGLPRSCQDLEPINPRSVVPGSLFRASRSIGRHRCQHCTLQKVDMAVGARQHTHTHAAHPLPEGSSTSASGRQPAGRTTQCSSSTHAASSTTGSTASTAGISTTVAGGSFPHRHTAAASSGRMALVAWDAVCQQVSSPSLASWMAPAPLFSQPHWTRELGHNRRAGTPHSQRFAHGLVVQTALQSCVAAASAA